eukprot:705998-Rhodomonas_salina.1
MCCCKFSRSVPDPALPSLTCSLMSILSSVSIVFLLCAFCWNFASACECPHRLSQYRTKQSEQGTAHRTPNAEDGQPQYHTSHSECVGRYGGILPPRTGPAVPSCPSPRRPAP